MTMIIKGILWPQTKRVALWMGGSLFPLLLSAAFMILIEIGLDEDAQFNPYFDLYAFFGQSISYFFMIAAVILMLCIESSPKAIRLRYPSYYFLLPVRTSSMYFLVLLWRSAVIFLYSLTLYVMMELFFLDASSRFMLPLGARAEFELAFYGAVVVLGIFLFLQGLTWATAMMRLNMAVAISLVAALFVLWCLSVIFILDDLYISPELAIALYIGGVMLSIVLGHLGVRLQRAGKVFTLTFPQRTKSYSTRDWTLRYRMFISPIRAQVWYEFRRVFWFLPLGGVVTIAVCVLIISEVNYGIPLAFTFLYAIALGLGFIADRKTSLHSNFALLRPMNLYQQSLARLCAGAMAVGCVFPILLVASILLDIPLSKTFYTQNQIGKGRFLSFMSSVAWPTRAAFCWACLWLGGWGLSCWLAFGSVSSVGVC